jgi:SOS-response transcriptional repressor LexA
VADAPSPRQLDVLELFVKAAQRAEPQPTYVEICDALDVSSTHGVYEHVTALCAKGWLERGGRGRSRCITLTEHTRAVYGLPKRAA